MLRNKALRWLIAILYVALFGVMWAQSKEPTWQDVPLLFGAGLVVALLSVIPFKEKKIDKVLMVLNIALLIANIVMYFAAFRMVSSLFKN